MAFRNALVAIIAGIGLGVAGIVFAAGQSSVAGPHANGLITPQSAVQPSWELVAAPANSCTVDTDLLATVDINNPSAASEQGELFVPGVGNVAHSFDNSFTGISPGNSFVIFLDTAYSVPAHTAIRMTINTFNLPNFAGGISFIDVKWWDCTTGQFVPAPPGGPIPTLSEWALVLLTLLVGLAGATMLLRRRRIQS